MSTPQTPEDPPIVNLPDASAPIPDLDPEPAEPVNLVADEAKRQAKQVAHTRSRAAYFAWIIGIVMLIVLLVFILRNQNSQEIDLLFWKVHLPVGVSLLIAAILGAILTLATTVGRMMELRRALKKVDKVGKKG